MDISLVSLSSLSALGSHRKAAENYANGHAYLTEVQTHADSVWAGRIPAEMREKVLSSIGKEYPGLDETVYFAIWCAREAVAAAGWESTGDFGLNLGSSRGATGLTETYHRQFLESGSVGTLASPSTTLGNIASWTAHDLGCRGPALSHSITCSTVMHAVLNACAWLESGMVKRFVAGGSEAPLTPFTFAQMQALKLYTRESLPYPSRPLDTKKTNNTLALGEGAAMACLVKGPHPRARASIAGVGFATEPMKHGASLSARADCLKSSMKMALKGNDPRKVDAVILHAPGTLKGDHAEVQAVKDIFGEADPQLISNKWKIGHTLGVSGMLSMELALLLLEGKSYTPPGYLSDDTRPAYRQILVNSVGFGGNAVSLLLTK